MYVHANPNPNGVYVEDCVIRAIAIATNRSWDDIYVHMCLRGNMGGRSMTMQYGRPMSYGRNGMSGRRYYDGEKDKAMNDLRRMMSMEQDPEKQAMIESAIHALEMK